MSVPDPCRDTTLSIDNTQEGVDRQHAGPTAFRYEDGMGQDGWRDRLEASITQAGTTMNAVSVRAGLAPNYVYDLLRRSKEPTLARFMKVCDAVPVSAAYILYGVDVLPEDEQILDLLHRHPSARANILALLKAASEPG